MTAKLILLVFVGALLLLSFVQYRNHVWNSRWQQCLRDARRIVQGVKNQYPGCEGAMNMAATTTTNPADFADRQQTLFNRKALKALQYTLALARYALSEGYSPNGRAIRFYRPRKANLAGINAENVAAFTRTITPLAGNAATALTEGSDAGITYSEVGVGYVDISQGQRLVASTVSDIASALDLLNLVAVQSETLGGDLALDYDRVVRDSLIDALFNSDASYANTGTNGGYFERFASIKPTGSSATDFAALAALDTVAGRITRGVNLGIVTQLANAGIPTINGNYVAITSPAVTHDIRQDELWLRAATFKGDPLYKDLDLMLDGVAFVKANNPWTEANAYGVQSVTDPGSGLVYSTIYLGKDAFGAPKLSNARAGSSPQAPRITILDKPDKSDIANRKTVLSAKSYYGAAPFICKNETGGAANAIGERPRYVILRSKSTFI